MDDIYNPMGTGNTEPISKTDEASKTELFNTPQGNAQQPSEQQTQQQSAPQQFVSQQSASQQSTQYPPQTPGNGPFLNNDNPQRFTTAQGYAPRQQQPIPQMPPFYYNPNGAANPNTPSNTQKKKTKKKKNGLAGKIIFIALICLSITFSSVAIGVTIADNDKDTSQILTGNNTNNNETVNQEDKFGPGASPSVEDSPLSFSEYSGKGVMTSEQIYNHIKDINVGVIVYSQGQDAGEGSGIVVGADETNTYTYILTAAHVIAESNIDVQIQFSDATEYDAEIIGIDTKTDVGVLRVKQTGFKAASFGNSEKLTVGQKVYAIGNPGGTEFFGSFTSGMISAIDRPVPTNNSSYDLPCIQHNAAINPGNSGGALVNEYGQVIGLNSSKISSTEYEGMGFSVPANTVLEVYNQIVRYGYVKNRPMLGINYMPISHPSYASIARKNDLPYGSIVIATISETSDIANKDVQVGDIITAVNGNKLETTDVLLETIENSKVGDKLTLTICRVNNSGTVKSTFDVTVKLIEDKGNTATPVEPETTPFDYFENFPY